MKAQLKQALKKALTPDEYNLVMQYHNGTDKERSMLMLDMDFVKLVAFKVAPITDEIGEKYRAKLKDLEEKEGV